jgi:hypothetical protein
LVRHTSIRGCRKVDDGATRSLLYLRPPAWGGAKSITVMNKVGLFLLRSSATPRAWGRIIASIYRQVENNLLLHMMVRGVVTSTAYLHTHITCTSQRIRSIRSLSSGTPTQTVIIRTVASTTTYGTRRMENEFRSNLRNRKGRDRRTEHL